MFTRNQLFISTNCELVHWVWGSKDRCDHSGAASCVCVRACAPHHRHPRVANVGVQTEETHRFLTCSDGSFSDQVAGFGGSAVKF